MTLVMLDSNGAEKARRDFRFSIEMRDAYGKPPLKLRVDSRTFAEKTDGDFVTADGLSFATFTIIP